MSDVKKIATRQAYGEALAELGEKYENLVVMDADLAASTKTAMFKKKYPDRFFDAGIAEANMVSMAAGLATAGKIVFASSFAMFATGRAYEQIRNSVGHCGLNVKIAATHGGITVGEDGATHQCLEDVSLMRNIPGMVVCVPSDYVEAKEAVKAAIEHEGPVFLRFGRSNVPVINDREDYKFELGKGVVLKEGSDVTIIGTGVCVDSVLQAEKMLAEEGINAQIVNTVHKGRSEDRRSSGSLSVLPDPFGKDKAHDQPECRMHIRDTAHDDLRNIARKQVNDRFHELKSDGGYCGIGHQIQKADFGMILPDRLPGQQVFHQFL